MEAPKQISEIMTPTELQGIRRLAMRLMWMADHTMSPAECAEKVDAEHSARSDKHLIAWEEYVGEYPNGHKLTIEDRGCMLGTIVRTFAERSELRRGPMQDYTQPELRQIRLAMAGDIAAQEEVSPERAQAERWFPMGWEECI